MKQWIRMFIFKHIWLITRPFQILIKWIEKTEALTKPKILLNTICIFTVVSLWLDSEILRSLLMIRFNLFTWLGISFSVIIYYWKHTDSRFGQLWLRDWKEKEKKMIEREEL